jgi:hypothetical protein
MVQNEVNLSSLLVHPILVVLGPGRERRMLVSGNQPLDVTTFLNRIATMTLISANTSLILHLGLVNAAHHRVR